MIPRVKRGECIGGGEKQRMMETDCRKSKDLDTKEEQRKRFKNALFHDIIYKSVLGDLGDLDEIH